MILLKVLRPNSILSHINCDVHTMPNITQEVGFVPWDGRASSRYFGTIISTAGI